MATTLAEEAALLAQLGEGDRVAVDTIGQSVEGRPIRLVRVGDPPPPDDRRTILYVGSQHGDEVAGREAMLEWIEHLANTSDSTEVEFLQSHGVMIIPTPNPDGTAADQRRNANGVDINRTHTTLDQPESQAIATALGRARPLIVMDHHEDQSNPTPDVRYRGPVNVQTYQGIIDESADLIDAIKARITADGYDPGDYPERPHEERLLGCSGLRGCTAVLIETDRFGQDLADRQAQHFATAQETLQYAAANITDLEQLVVDAAAAVAAEGEAGTAAFQVYNGTNHGDSEVILDPPPLGYRLSGLAPTRHLTAFNIAVTGSGVVQMGQAAQPIIPYLFDAAAEFGATTATRLFELDSPPTIATVSELAPIVSGSHIPVIEVRVLHEFQTGPDPDGETLRVHGGNVEYDATAEVLASIEVDVAGVDPDTGRSMHPRLASDTLAPYGTELFARRGIDVGDDILWSPLGYFRLDAVEQDDAPYGQIKISGQDRWVGLEDARLLRPREYAPQTQAAALFADLVGDVYPDATVQFDDEAAFADIGRRLVAEDSRTEVLREVASSLGKIVHWDGEGILRVRDAPDEDEPVWQVRAGRGGVLVTAARRVSREGSYNAMVAVGEGGDTEEPVRGVAMDVGPNSPTRWGGPFGKVPRRYSSPMIRTEAQATRAARQMLRRQLGMPSNADFGSVVNPALRPWHPVLVAQRDGNRETHVIERLTIPLTAAGEMQAETRERTRVVLGAVVE